MPVTFRGEQDSNLLPGLFGLLIAILLRKEKYARKATSFRPTALKERRLAIAKGVSVRAEIGIGSFMVSSGSLAVLAG